MTFFAFQMMVFYRGPTTGNNYTGLLSHQTSLPSTFYLAQCAKRMYQAPIMEWGKMTACPQAITAELTVQMWWLIYIYFFGVWMCYHITHHIIPNQNKPTPVTQLTAESYPSPVQSNLCTTPLWYNSILSSHVHLDFPFGSVPRDLPFILPL